MESDPTLGAKIRAAFSQRMAQNALEDQEQYSLRTGTVLDAHGFLDGVHHDPVEPDLLAIVARADHPARVPTPPGPLLFYRDLSDAASVTCVELPDLLLHREPSVRAAAIQFFQRLGPGVRVEQTSRAIERLAADVAADGERAWQTAAVHVFDAVEKDHLLALAGLRQSLSLGHGAMVRKFVLRALRPSLLSVDNLGSEIMVVATGAPEVARRIDEIARNAGSIADLCAAYFDAFGHLPLARSLSLAQAVGTWQQEGRAARPAPGDWWPQVWSWTERAGSPLARYQALSLFAQRPDLLADGQRQEWWHEVFASLQPATEESANSAPWRAALKFRQSTAAHYYDYLACRANPLSEDVLGEWAWWMAERFCACFGAEPELLERLRQEAVLPVSRQSAYEISLTPPRPKRSSLWLATMLGKHLWSLSLLNTIDGEFMAASTPGFSDSQAEQFVRRLSLHLAFAPPRAVDDAGPPVYAVDRPLIDTVRTWGAAAAPTKLWRAFQTMIADASGRFDPAALLARLEKLTSLSREEQFLTVLNLRLLLSTGHAPNAALLARASEPDWLEGAMRGLEPDVCENLLGAFCTSPYPEHEAWLGWLYKLAAVGERPALAAERRTLIFRYIALACAVSQSAGPLAKLLNGPERHLFSEDASVCLAKLEAAYPTCSQAVRATIRAVTSVLHAA